MIDPPAHKSKTVPGPGHCWGATGLHLLRAREWKGSS